MGAIVQTDEGKRLRAAYVTLIAKRRHLAHVAFRHGGSVFHIGFNVRQQFDSAFFQTVVLFSDRKACHLQAVGSENFSEPQKFGLMRAVGAQSLGNAADNRFINSAVSLQCDKQAEIVVRTVSPSRLFPHRALCGNYALFS